jgi:uncharacterized protein
MLKFEHISGIIMNIIGRFHQQQRLTELMQSGQSEFIAVYGRRRTGKTFLIREYFNYEFSFYTSGLDDDRMIVQLAGFHASLRQSAYYEECAMPQTWMEAFEQLTQILARDERKNKIVFIDELPWLETSDCDLKAALDWFWNKWASARKDIKLIVCGSAASWMVKTFINDGGGFYNRVTETMKIAPFNLAETKLYLESKDIYYDHYQIMHLYMALGGIPYYLNKVKKGFSASQNIDKIFFGKQALVKNEYTLLFKSLFKNHKRHIDVITVLFKKKKGLNRAEITKALKITDGGSFSDVLEELVAADFISVHALPGTTKRNVLYKIADHYILFHKNFVEKYQGTANFWINNCNTPAWYAWAGLAFEQTCFQHIAQIKNALGIQAVQANMYAWANRHAQIDLIIDRKDRVVNLIEIKFSDKAFAMTAEYEKSIVHKTDEYKAAYPSGKSILQVLITTYGLKSMKHAGIFAKVITMDDLFVAVKEA